MKSEYYHYTIIAAIIVGIFSILFPHLIGYFLIIVIFGYIILATGSLLSFFKVKQVENDEERRTGMDQLQYPSTIEDTKNKKDPIIKNNDSSPFSRNKIFFALKVSISILIPSLLISGFFIGFFSPIPHAIITQGKVTEMNVSATNTISNNPIFWDDRGNSFYNHGYFTEAMQSYDNALAIYPNDSMALYQENHIRELQMDGYQEPTHALCIFVDPNFVCGNTIITPFPPLPTPIPTGTTTRFQSSIQPNPSDYIEVYGKGVGLTFLNLVSPEIDNVTFWIDDTNGNEAFLGPDYRGSVLDYPNPRNIFDYDLGSGIPNPIIFIQSDSYTLNAKANSSDCLLIQGSSTFIYDHPGQSIFVDMHCSG